MTYTYFDHLKAAEYQLREALAKALLCKSSDFVEKIKEAHGIVLELIEEA